MFFSPKMVIKDINCLKNNFKNLYEDTLELYTAISEKMQSLNNPNKRGWEYATYTYLKSVLYERKNKYKKMFKAICEIESFINKINEKNKTYLV